MAEALLELLYREMLEVKLFQGQMELVRKTANVMGRLDPNWKEINSDRDMFAQAVQTYCEEHTANDRH